MAQERKKLNWKEACKILGCGKKRFYCLVKGGHLPAYRLAGMKRGLWVYEEDVRALSKTIVVATTSS